MPKRTQKKAAPRHKAALVRAANGSLYLVSPGKSPRRVSAAEAKVVESHLKTARDEITKVFAKKNRTLVGHCVNVTAPHLEVHWP